jgi:D-alanyl-lipoteichoic acid acyltransferase DltB (MBOAT superfamily)
MLAVYLHHDSSVLTNVFCTQALCADSVCSFLNENFVTFGWDLTNLSNKTRAVNMITKHFGSVASSTLKNMDIERLPVLVLIYKLRGSVEIFQVC